MVYEQGYMTGFDATYSKVTTEYQNYITIILQWYRELRRGVNEEASAHSSKKKLGQGAINKFYQPEKKKERRKITINQFSLK